MAENLLADPVVPAVPPSPEEQMAAKLFGDMKKPEPAPLPDDATTAEKMFSGMQSYGDAERVISGALVEHDGITREAAQIIGQEWSPVFAAAGLNSTESSAVAEVGAAIYQRPPSDDQRQQWASMAQEALRADFGPEGAGQALADARALVQKLSAKHPGIVAWLDAGAGDHPQVARVLAARARELRKAGRL